MTLPCPECASGEYWEAQTDLFRIMPRGVVAYDLIGDCKNCGLAYYVTMFVDERTWNKESDFDF